MTAPAAPPPVRIKYRVPYADTDQMGIVYYSNYLVYFERLRNELLRHTGISYREWERRGFRLPVVESRCEYLAPAHYDDILTVSGRVSALRRASIRIDYEVRRGDALLVRGHTVHACLDRRGQAVRIPAELREPFTLN